VGAAAATAARGLLEIVVAVAAAYCTGSVVVAAATIARDATGEPSASGEPPRRVLGRAPSIHRGLARAAGV
jgi:hypothetical protein